MKKSRLNYITLILLNICFCAGVLYLIVLAIDLTVPILQYDGIHSLRFNAVRDARYHAYTVCWMCGTVCMLIIIHTLIRMMKTIGADPFIRANVLHLRRMGIVALILVGFTLTAFFIYHMPLILIIAMMELMCALFALVLRSVFEKAVDYREENALTI